jgi:hypothetical protein
MPPNTLFGKVEKPGDGEPSARPDTGDEREAGRVNPATLRVLTLRIAVSLLLAAVFQAAWTSLFILLYRSSGSIVRAFLWIAGPPVIAAGFALGLTLFRWKAQPRWAEYLRCYVWPLAGSATGAVAGSPIGPMFAGFGMFALGTLAVTIYEVRLVLRPHHDESI